MAVKVSDLAGALTANQVITSITVDATTSPISDGDELALVSAGQEVRGIIADGDSVVGVTSVPIKSYVLRVAVPDEAKLMDRSKTALVVDELEVTDKATVDGDAAVSGDETVGGDMTITGAESANSNTP